MFHQSVPLEVFLALPGPCILGCLAFGSCIAATIAHSILDIYVCGWGSEQSQSQVLRRLLSGLHRPEASLQTDH